MIILGIETSCDETAVCVVEATGGLESPSFSVLGNGLFSQVALHAPYGGVYPNLAKREHGRNLPPLLQKALQEGQLWENSRKEGSDSAGSHDSSVWKKIEGILSKEQGLFETFKELISSIKRPSIDLIAVTSGPGLEPALWVGISFAEALGLVWGIPVLPINHMEGHITSVLLDGGDEVKSRKLKVESANQVSHLISHISTPVQFPALALLISGGHTELVEIQNWGRYKKIGQTRDDAVGEAFDKVARMLSLPYPGGPEVSKQAHRAREKNLPQIFTLPRPMIHSNDFDFSFSGLKTSVLYTLRDHKKQTDKMTEDEVYDLCREFENSVTDVLLSKTGRALEEHGARTLIIAGGVVANTHIRQSFTALIQEKFPDITLRIPTKNMATDNALMIASAGYIEYLLHPENVSEKIKAQGNMSF